MRRVITVLVIIIALLLAFIGMKHYQGAHVSDKLTSKSKDLLSAEVLRNEHVFGAYVVKTTFKTKESAVLWADSSNPLFLPVARRLLTPGTSGIGAEYFDARNSKSELLTEAISKGQIACDDIENSTLPFVLPEIVQYARTVCFAPLPPFDSNVRQVIVILIETKKEKLDLQALRREILRVQLEVYHREYLNQDIWIRKM